MIEIGMDEWGGENDEHLHCGVWIRIGHGIGRGFTWSGFD